MTTIGINLLVYMQELNNGTAQSALLPTIAGHGVTLAEVRREYIKDDAEFDRIRETAEANGLDLFYSVPESLTTAARPIRVSKASWMRRYVWASGTSNSTKATSRMWTRR